MNIKKQMVITKLAELQHFLTLPALLKTLDSTFSERSVRRWLGEFVKMGHVIKTGNKRNTRYKIAETSTTPSVVHPLFSSTSQKSIAKIRQPIFTRSLVTYNRKWLENYEPNKTFYLTPEQRDVLHKHGEKDRSPAPAGTFARKMYNRLLIDLSYYSSRLEGNTYSIVDTEKLVLEGIANTSKLTEETTMILNHKEAIRYLVDRIQKISIHPVEICTLHYLLSDSLVLPKYAGKIRDHGVRISASTYIPLEDDIRLDQFLRDICRKASEIIDPFEQSIFLLVHIAYLQAFTDVNKRTARLSANIPLLKNNVVPFSFNAIDKEDYLSAMIAIYELNDAKPLSELYVFSYVRTCQEYSVLHESVNFDEVRVRFRSERRNMLNYIITHALIGKKLKDYIKMQTSQHIPAQHRKQFIKNVDEDLVQLSPQRITGLGITATQLKRWLKINSSSQ